MRTPKRFRRAAVFAAGALLVLAAAAAGQRTPPRKVPEAARDLPVPFEAGEQLDFRIGWTLYSRAAEARLEVRERRPFYGRHAWHFQATARTLQPVRALFEVDDQFDSYTDTLTLRSLQYEMYLNELGKSQEVIVQMRIGDEPARAGRRSVVVPEGTRDPLGLIYHLRTVDWARQRTLAVPVHDGRKLYQVRARLADADVAVRTPAGHFAARQIEIEVLEGGQPVRGVSFQLYLARDRARTPVRIDASLPFGSLRVELERIGRRGR